MLSKDTGIPIVFASMKIQGEMHDRVVLIDYSVYQRKDEFHVSLTKASNYQTGMSESRWIDVFVLLKANPILMARGVCSAVTLTINRIKYSDSKQ